MSERVSEFLRYIVPHQMYCAIYSPYPHRSDKPCDCPTSIVIKLEDEIQALKAELKELQFQKVFEKEFADKLKEFGTVDRLIEEYSASKMKTRDVEAQLPTLYRLIRERDEKITDLSNTIFEIRHLTNKLTKVLNDA